MAATSSYVHGLGVRFESTCNGKAYVSVDYHRTGQPNGTKSIWSVTREAEFALFDVADERNQHDESGYWGFLDPKMAVLGASDERIARFPAPPAGTDFWHGFPYTVTPRQRPSSEMIDAWAEQGWITWPVGARMKKGKL